jgi:hypothetical protein
VTEYIDYFGNRSGLVKQSFFYLENQPQNRILLANKLSESLKVA